MDRIKEPFYAKSLHVFWQIADVWRDEKLIPLQLFCLGVITKFQTKMPKRLKKVSTIGKKSFERSRKLASRRKYLYAFVYTWGSFFGWKTEINHIQQMKKILVSFEKRCPFRNKISASFLLCIQWLNLIQAWQKKFHAFYLSIIECRLINI